MTSCRKYAALAAPLLLALSACSEEPAPAAVDGEREASGEVLEGTISDAMLPVDELRSQPPLAAPEPSETGSASAPSSAAPATPSAASEPAPAPAEATGDAEPTDAPADE